jgi:Cell Wall Hydrolase
VDPATVANLYLIALCVYREARGESIEAKLGVAWVIRNRVKLPRWWGHDWISVILHHFQFSSFNATNNVQAETFPGPSDPSWADCWNAANVVYAETPSFADPTNGATYYYDKSLDNDPPAFTKNGTIEQSAVIGALRFWRSKQ